MVVEAGTGWRELLQEMPASAPAQGVATVVAIEEASAEEAAMVVRLEVSSE